MGANIGEAGVTKTKQRNNRRRRNSKPTHSQCTPFEARQHVSVGIRGSLQASSAGSGFERSPCERSG